MDVEEAGDLTPHATKADKTIATPAISTLRNLFGLAVALGVWVMVLHSEFLFIGYPTCDTLSRHICDLYLGPYLLDMLKMRLKRLGKKREVSYRIVIAQSTSRRDGRPIAEVGFHNPRSNETRLNEEAITEWLKQGAQPTDTVRSILAKANLIEKQVRPTVAPKVAPEAV